MIHVAVLKSVAHMIQLFSKAHTCHTSELVISVLTDIVGYTISSRSIHKIVFVITKNVVTVLFIVSSMIA